MTEHNTKIETVTLMGKNYQDLTYIEQPAVSAYIQCSWFSDKQIEHMNKGLEAIAQNPTVFIKAFT